MRDIQALEASDRVIVAPWHEWDAAFCLLFLHPAPFRPVLTAPGPLLIGHRDALQGRSNGYAKPNGR